jgi:pseudaminic acid synthase
MQQEIYIGNTRIARDAETFIIAELSANHNGKFDNAVQIIREAKRAGANAIKLQTYTPDTITIKCENPCFMINQGTLWDKLTLYQLYEQAYTPWDWQPKLKEIAEEEGLEFLSSPFDITAVNFLEQMGVSAYKVASFEMTDTPLISYMASKGKPMIMSTGISTLAEIEEAVNVCNTAQNSAVILLKCTSAYPAPYVGVNLRTIRHMAETFEAICGLSDHTLGIEVPIGAVALGAKVIEKHMTISRANGGPDAAFSLEPDEFAQMVRAIRNIEQAIGKVTYKLDMQACISRSFSRSLFAVQDITRGESFTTENVRSIRPGNGLHPRFYPEILGLEAAQDIPLGTPLNWALIRPVPNNEQLS